MQLFGFKVSCLEFLVESLRVTNSLGPVKEIVFLCAQVSVVKREVLVFGFAFRQVGRLLDQHGWVS